MNAFKAGRIEPIIAATAYCPHRNALEFKAVFYVK